ncbi:Hint domain-containing protein [Hyunsoonleella pacifica]|uniref:Uncharacterized protein n=1 Tax=Hyunsoonleella pacifica TaxID=1080224 RepID=A0A4Q9FV19_9FLAO|nr:Hint domain-containing protein [Hyunsoonleella pacifica]TBN17889.1 hypothetical protein EYD46_06160 [Hyunsoonleella pacifica]GGD08049.1 hypothetical protein GCM10011368_07520 [Hyunsoonleella pacifica]
MMKKLILLLFGALYINNCFSQELALLSNAKPELSSFNSFIYYRPQNVFENPYLFSSTFTSKPISADYYSKEDIELQKELNKKEEGIITFSDGEAEFYMREIDREDITPYTWKWVHLQVKEEDGSYTNVHLRRPNWWFLEHNATKIGDKVHINIPQIGLDKEVTILKIYPNQLDTRFWDLNQNGNTVVRPLIGKVEHYVNNVVNLHLEDGNKPISVTKNHLLWSQDRDDWVKVSDLKIGEKLTTKQETVTVKDIIAKEGWYVVYDIEVYRDHNFLVSTQNILAHNGCTKKTGTTHNGFYEVVKEGQVNYAGKGPSTRAKSSRKRVEGDKVVHYQLTEGIGHLSLKETAEIMEHKLGLMRAKQQGGGNFTDLDKNRINSPGKKRYEALSQDMKEQIDKAFEEIISKGGETF